MAIPLYQAQQPAAAGTGNVLADPSLAREGFIGGVARAMAAAGDLGAMIQEERDTADIGQRQAEAVRYWTRQQQELRQGMDPAGLTSHADTVDGLFQDWAAEQIAAAPSPGVQRALTGYYQTLGTRLYSENQNWSMAEHTRVAAGQLDQALGDLVTAAYDDPARAGELLSDSGALVADAGWASPSTRAEAEIAARARIQEAALRGRIAGGDWRGVLGLLEPGADSEDGPDPLVDAIPLGTRTALVAAAQAEQRRAEAQARAAAALARAETAGQVDNVQRVLDAGFDPGAEAVTAALAAAQGSGDQRLVDAALAAQDQHNVYTAMATMPLAEQQRQIAEFEGQAAGNGWTAAEVDRHAMLVSTAEGIAARLQRDPVGYAVTSGLIAQPPTVLGDQAFPVPGSGSGGITAEESLRRNVEAAAFVNDYFGATGPLIRPQFAETLSQGWREGSDDQRVALAGAIAAGAGTHAGQVLTEIAGDEPVLAHMATLVQVGDPATARDMAIGYRLASEGDAPGLTPSQWRLADAALGGAFAHDPALQQRVLAGARYIATARLQRNPALLSDGDDAGLQDLAERALQESAGAWFDADGIQHGGVAVVGGRPVAIPQAVTAAEADDLFAQLTPPLLAAGGVNGAPQFANGDPVQPEQMDSLYPQAVGDGQYLMLTEDPRVVARPGALVGADGRPFVFDLNRTANGLRRVQQASERNMDDVALEVLDSLLGGDDEPAADGVPAGADPRVFGAPPREAWDSWSDVKRQSYLTNHRLNPAAWPLPDGVTP